KTPQVAAAAPIGLAAKGKPLPYRMTRKTLKNGLRVVLVPIDSPGLVAYYTLVRTGARNEVEAGHTGFAHFFEHIMFRGTEKHTTMGFIEDIRAMPTRYAYSLKFFDRFYRPNNCTLFVVGDFDPAATLGDLEKHYGAWKGRAQAPRVVAEPAQKREKTVEVPW